MNSFKNIISQSTIVLTHGYHQFGFLLIRISISLLMFRHGLDKLVNFTEKKADFLHPFGIGSGYALMLAIFAEAFCSILVSAGLFTRLAIIPLITTMCVAILIAHAGDPFPHREMAVIYLAIFVGILIYGPGRYSLDSHLWLNKRSVRQAS